MAQPTPYARDFDFAPLAPPNVPEVGERVNGEFDAVKRTTDEIRDSLEQIQRDDGMLRNQSVHPEALSARVRAIIAGGWALKGPWVTATAYAAKDVVSQGGVLYVCVQAHVAGTFSTDQASGFWLEFYDESPVPADGTVTFAMLSSTAITQIADAVAALLPRQPTVEIGCVFAYAGGTAPTGYLLCAGQVLNRADYSGLFARIGTAHNDGSETVLQFRVPDYRGRTLVGRDNMGGTAANRITTAVAGFDGSLLGAAGGDQRRPRHSHSIGDPGHVHGASTLTNGEHTHSYQNNIGGSHNGTNNDGATGANSSNTTRTTGPAGGHNHEIQIVSAVTNIVVNQDGTGNAQNVQPSAVVNWIIYAGGGAVNDGDTPSGGGGLGSGGPWQLTFLPTDNRAPATNGAAFDTRNGTDVLDFDATTQETAIFRGTLPRGYADGGLTLRLTVAMTSATSGTVGFDVAFERLNPGASIASDNWGTVTDFPLTTVPGTAGQTAALSVDIPSGSSMSGLQAGEVFRMRVRRTPATDTATGDAELVSADLYETA